MHFPWGVRDSRIETLVTHATKVTENGCHCTRARMYQSRISTSAGLCLLAYSGSGGIMVWVVSEHSSCTVMGMFLTAFRHLALMMFCMPYGQLGVFFFLFFSPPISVLNNFTSSRANSKKQASSAGLLLLVLKRKKVDVLSIPTMLCLNCTYYFILLNHLKFLFSRV